MKVALNTYINTKVNVSNSTPPFCNAGDHHENIIMAFFSGFVNKNVLNLYF